MGVRVLATDGQGRTCLFCSTSGWAFGPLFDDADEADAFLKWWHRNYTIDPRSVTDHVLVLRVEMFREAVRNAAAELDAATKDAK